MTRQPRIERRAYVSPREPFDNIGSDGARVVTTNRKLLTSAWTAEVATLETAIGQFTARRSLVNDCHVVFFEIAGDDDLHVNVTHQHATREVRGWAGPGRLPDGFVHNRRFGDAAPAQILRHIREIVFADRI
jgi:hypothetical protein